MGKLGAYPPCVAGAVSKLTKQWVRSLVLKVAELLLDGDQDGREEALMRAAAARFIAKYAGELEIYWVKEAQKLGASNEQVARTLGVRSATTSRRFPNPRVPVTWKARRSESQHDRET